MAKKQTRRSVSIRGSTYEQIRLYCERNNISMSEFVEDRIATFFGGAMRAQKGGKRLDTGSLQEAARIFTF